jgi:hypothetical protein
VRKEAVRNGGRCGRPLNQLSKVIYFLNWKEFEALNRLPPFGRNSPGSQISQVNRLPQGQERVNI